MRTTGLLPCSSSRAPPVQFRISPPELVLSKHSWPIVRSEHCTLHLGSHDAPAPWERTADFVYLRGHGPSGRYEGRYSSTTLTAWRKSIFFGNAEIAMSTSTSTMTKKARPPMDALALRGLLVDFDCLVPKPRRWPLGSVVTVRLNRKPAISLHFATCPSKEKIIAHRRFPTLTSRADVAGHAGQNSAVDTVKRNDGCLRARQ